MTRWFTKLWSFQKDNGVTRIALTSSSSATRLSLIALSTPVLHHSPFQVNYLLDRSW
jgi:hypothetical protein